MVPDDVSALGMPERMCATLVRSKHFTCYSGTCVGTVARHLEFFLVSDSLVGLIRDVRVIELKPRPHVPVRLRFKSFRYITTVRVPFKTNPLPADRPFGPDVFHDWSEMLEVHTEDQLQDAKQAIAAAPDGGVGFVRSLINHWECLAER